MAKGMSSGKGMSKAGSGGGGKTAGGMPPNKIGGGVNLGTTHGNHHVSHPIQGGSGSQKIDRGTFNS